MLLSSVHQEKFYLRCIEILLSLWQPILVTLHVEVTQWRRHSSGSGLLTVRGHRPRPRLGCWHLDHCQELSLLYYLWQVSVKEYLGRLIHEDSTWILYYCWLKSWWSLIKLKLFIYFTGLTPFCMRKPVCCNNFKNWFWVLIGFVTFLLLGGGQMDNDNNWARQEPNIIKSYC